jgi:hypothetical protein
MIRHAPYADGPAGFDIGLTLIEPSEWLEGGEDAPALRKDALFAADPQRVWGEMEGSRAGQAEVAAMVALATGQTPDPALPPLLAAARLVPDDLVLMEKRGESWTTTALSLCAGSFFTAQQALGLSLDGLHGPAAPGVDETMLTRMRRMFDHIPEGKILQRRNWTVVSDSALSIPDPAPMRAAIAEIDPADAGRRLFIRVERQTLRRLPQTGGVLFTIRVWRHPLDDLRGAPQTLKAFAAAWRGADPAFRAYKRLHLYDAPVQAFLRQAGEI